MAADIVSNMSVFYNSVFFLIFSSALHYPKYLEMQNYFLNVRILGKCCLLLLLLKNPSPPLPSIIEMMIGSQSSHVFSVKSFRRLENIFSISQNIADF